LSHPRGAEAGDCVSEEGPDSKEFIMSRRAYRADFPCAVQRTKNWTLDAGVQEKDDAPALIKISIFVFDFNRIYAMVYIFQ
jgi:hypothetical protein